jgi:hypothetical protein
VSGDGRFILLETGREDVGILSIVWRGRRAREEVRQVSSGSYIVCGVQESIAPPREGVDGFSTSLKKGQSVEISNELDGRTVS